MGWAFSHEGPLYGEGPDFHTFLHPATNLKPAPLFESLKFQNLFSCCSPLQGYLAHWKSPTLGPYSGPYGGHMGVAVSYERGNNGSYGGPMGVVVSYERGNPVRARVKAQTRARAPCACEALGQLGQDRTGPARLGMTLEPLLGFTALYRMMGPSSGSNVVLRWASPGLAILRPHSALAPCARSPCGNMGS